MFQSSNDLLNRRLI